MKEEYKELKELQKRYLTRLSDLYPTIAAASTEIINLQAILNLPKGTEHFLTDVHGEYEAFSHVLKNGSGSVRRKIEDVFGNTMSAADKKSLATLIYYPRAKMDLIRQTETNMEDRSTVRQKRDAKEIGISALRGGTIVGEHEVIFAGTDEVIEFKHTAYSRSVFGKGAVEAAKFLAGKESGMYDMSDVVGL